MKKDNISMPYLEILSLLKNSSTLKLEVRGFQWLPKKQTIGICNRYWILKFPVVRRTLELNEITVNTLEDIFSSDLPSLISSDVTEDIIFFAKQLFNQNKIRKSFNNDNPYEVPQKHSSYPITFTFTVFVVTRLQWVLILVV